MLHSVMSTLGCRDAWSSRAIMISFARMSFGSCFLIESRKPLDIVGSWKFLAPRMFSKGCPRPSSCLERSPDLLVRTSAFLFCFPGQNLIMKSYSARYRNHITCRRFRHGPRFNRTSFSFSVPFVRRSEFSIRVWAWRVCRLLGSLRHTDESTNALMRKMYI